jgi:flagellar biosynthesis chaperone FliJ
VRAGKKTPGTVCPSAARERLRAGPLKSRLRHAEAKVMRPKTRLDPVIKLEEKNEERRLQEMAAAARQRQSAEEALSGAKRAATTDHRHLAPAMDWQLAEIAHTRALHDVRTAEHAVKSATASEASSRKLYTAAHSKAEALRRVAQARVDEIIAAREKTETREMDEVGLVLFNNHGPRAT